MRTRFPTTGAIRGREWVNLTINKNKQGRSGDNANLGGEKRQYWHNTINNNNNPIKQLSSREYWREPIWKPFPRGGKVKRQGRAPNQGPRDTSQYKQRN